MDDVTVAVATYGDEAWAQLAWDRAIPSARGQAPYVHAHGDTLAVARNAALDQVDTDWVIHLDADDELSPGYVDALRAGIADIRAPAVQYVAGARDRAPYVPRVAGHVHDCDADCLQDGNWIVIGALARAQLLRDVGGWREWACYEDWDLWQRCWIAGATIEPLPAAVYRAHVRQDSRNRCLPMEEKNAVHYAITEANLPTAA